MEARALLQEYLHSSAHSWSIGIAGAIGEFMYDDDEEVVINSSDSELSVLSPRGALKVSLYKELHYVAYEDLSSCTRSWSQNVAFCLPEASAKVDCNQNLVCLGEDEAAVRVSSSRQVLFDIGLGSSQVQFCVRTDNPELLDILHAACGRSIFAEGNPAAAAILEYSPCRVVVSATGRVEIETKIPKAATETDTGPHTHLLPHLLKNAEKYRSPALPAGYNEVLSLYPEHPVFDKYGEAQVFQATPHENFQRLLREAGEKEYWQEKVRLQKQLKDDEHYALPKELETGSWQQRAVRIAKIQAPFIANK